MLCNYTELWEANQIVAYGSKGDITYDMLASTLLYKKRNTGLSTLIYRNFNIPLIYGTGSYKWLLNQSGKVKSDIPALQKSDTLFSRINVQFPLCLSRTETKFMVPALLEPAQNLTRIERFRRWSSRFAKAERDI